MADGRPRLLPSVCWGVSFLQTSPGGGWGWVLGALVSALLAGLELGARGGQAIGGGAVWSWLWIGGVGELAFP